MSETPNYARLTLKEWRGIIATTDAQYRKALGNRPTRADVRKEIENPYAVNILQAIAMVLLGVLAIFTGFKVGALAVPFAKGLFDHLTNGAVIDSRVLSVFTGVTFFLFWLLSTPGLIYFKLLSHDERLIKQREDTAGKVWTMGMISLDYISPRLPSVMTYIIMAWLFAISIAGGGTVFEIFIPVLAEVALAQLVGDILEQNASFARVVADRLKMERTAYDTRLNNKNDDERVSLLAAVMTETLTNLARGNQRPNMFMEKADREVIRSILQAEYARLTVTDNFIKDMGGKANVIQGEKLSTGEMPILAPETNLSGSKPANVVKTPKNARYTPPNGAKTWTVKTLAHKLRVINADPSKYSQIDLARDFAPNYGARSVFRSDEFKKEFQGARA